MEVHHLPQVQIQIQIQKLSGRWENHMRHHPPHLINAFFWDLWILKTPGRAKLEDSVAYMTFPVATYFVHDTAKISEPPIK